MPQLKEIVLGKWQDWALLMVISAGVYLMGTNLLHVRRFALFAVVLLALVTLALAYMVWAYEPDQVVTREGFDDAALPHGATEIDEV